MINKALMSDQGRLEFESGEHACEFLYAGKRHSAIGEDKRSMLSIGLLYRELSRTSGNNVRLSRGGR